MIAGKVAKSEETKYGPCSLHSWPSFVWYAYLTLLYNILSSPNKTERKRMWLGNRDNGEVGLEKGQEDQWTWRHWADNVRKLAHWVPWWLDSWTQGCVFPVVRDFICFSLFLPCLPQQIRGIGSIVSTFSKPRNNSNKAQCLDIKGNDAT